MLKREIIVFCLTLILCVAASYGQSTSRIEYPAVPPIWKDYQDVQSALNNLVSTNTFEAAIITTNALASLSAAQIATSNLISNVTWGKVYGATLESTGLAGFFVADQYAENRIYASHPTIHTQQLGTNSFLAVANGGVLQAGLTNATVEIYVNGKREGVPINLPNDSIAYTIGLTWPTFRSRQVSYRTTSHVLVQNLYGTSNLFVYPPAWQTTPKIVIMGNSQANGNILSAVGAKQRAWSQTLSHATKADVQLECVSGTTMLVGGGDTYQNRASAITNRWSNPDLVIVENFTDPAIDNQAALVTAMLAFRASVANIVTCPVLWIPSVYDTTGSGMSNAVTAVNTVIATYPQDKLINFNFYRSAQDVVPYVENSHFNDIMHEFLATDIINNLITNFPR